MCAIAVKLKTVNSRAPRARPVNLGKGKSRTTTSIQIEMRDQVVGWVTSEAYCAMEEGPTLQRRDRQARRSRLDRRNTRSPATGVARGFLGSGVMLNPERLVETATLKSRAVTGQGGSFEDGIGDEGRGRCVRES